MKNPAAVMLGQLSQKKMMKKLGKKAYSERMRAVRAKRIDIKNKCL